ncbi:histidine phosphatase family protein [Patescibacteria group bacterium]|nr:histidine phosphatase family protein [Patescibacteria group bacterium]MBP9709610.1 histidine phosphatase family protein [Patescibacteria group bacterium]
MFALIRHGAYSIYPDHLTPEGEGMVLALAERLAALQAWTRICASPRIRTQETAAIIGRVLSLPVELDESLLETASHDAWMPPHDLSEGTILVTHVPVIREIGNAWAKHFQVSAPPTVGVSEGLLIDPRASTIKKIS